MFSFLSVLKFILQFFVILMWVYPLLGQAHQMMEAGNAHVDEDEYLADLMRSAEVLASKRLGRKTATTMLSAAALDTDKPGQYGQWSALTWWPFSFASAANLPDGRILAWGGNNRFFFKGSSITYTYGAVWDPVTGQLTSADHPSHALFCGMPVMLEDGRVFVNGGILRDGSSLFGTSVFDYRDGLWTRLQDMASGRWYPGSVALPNGQVFTAAGQPGSAYPELWTEGVGWSYLNGAKLQTAILDFPTITEPNIWLPHFHLAPNGKLIHSGHTPEMHLIDPTNNGSIAPLSITNTWNTANIPGVLFDEGKLLQAGGALYDKANTATGNAAVLDFNGTVPTRTVIPPMQYPRIFHNQVVLPDGQVLVVGGNTTGVKFSDEGSQMTPELWNTETQTWRPLAPIQVPRNYHSVALLLPDGRVWSGGGGLCLCLADHPNSQVFSPPYLFNDDGSLASRPEILDSPDTVSYGLNAKVAASPAIKRFTMIRMSATTHALNSDMRFLSVPFTELAEGQYLLKFHTNRNVLTPGYWMLFALNAQGVPSVAKVLQVRTSEAPVLANPGDQSSLLGVTVMLPLLATDPNGDPLIFSALGLPQGLVLDAATGVVSGVPLAVGDARVVLAATDGQQTATASLIWHIVPNSQAQAGPVFGSNGGEVFADVPTASQILKKINLRVSQRVDAVQAVPNSGKFSRHGGLGGLVVRVEWPADEYLVRIFGSYDAQIRQLGLVTNTGRTFGPYGAAKTDSAVTRFDFTAPPNYEIVGFTGRADGVALTAIGVLYRSHPVANQPPWPQLLADQVDSAGSPVNLPIIAKDADGDTLTYQATGLPPGLTMGTATGVVSGKPTQQGKYDVTVTIQDQAGASSALAFHWQITAPLTLAAINTAPQPTGTDIMFSTQADHAVHPLFRWSFGDGSVDTAYSTDNTISHRFAAPGLYVVQATVTDDTGAVVSATTVQAVYAPATAQAPASSTKLLVTAVSGGEQLWLANPDHNSVSVFAAQTRARLAEIPVGHAPRSLAVAPNGRVWVVAKYSASLSMIDPLTRRVVKNVALPRASQPEGVVFAPDGKAAYVVLSALGQVLKLDPVTAKTLAVLNVGANPRHIAVTADSRTLLLPRYITNPLPGESTAKIFTVSAGRKLGGEVLVADAKAMAQVASVTLPFSSQQDSENQGAGLPNYLGAPAMAPDGQTAWLPAKQDNIQRGVLRNGSNLNFSNTVRAIASKITLPGLTEDYPARIDFDNSGLASAAVYDRYGNYLFVALEASREVAIVDAYGGRELRRIAVGRAPDALAVSGDGKTLYVNNFMDRTVSAVDLTALLARGETHLPVVAQLPAVSAEILAPQVLQGKQLFYDAQDPRLAADGYLSCAVCHNDGGHDGRVWDLTGFGEGLRNTVNLRGRAGMAQGLLHWSGNFDESQDFEGQIRSLAGGKGLMDDAVFAQVAAPLGAPKTGLSADLDALAAYLASLNQFSASPLRQADGSMTDSAVAGGLVFKRAGCGQCHGGQPYTDSPSGLRHNVGTLRGSSGQRLGAALTGLDVPTLRDVWQTAPYLHNGSAPTLADAISAHTGLNLSVAEIGQVADYVSQLGDSKDIPTNQAPQVALTAPAAASHFKSGQSIKLTAFASDPDGQVAKVVFYADHQLLASTSGDSPAYVWQGATVGYHQLFAKAYDNFGALTVSTVVTVKVD